MREGEEGEREAGGGGERGGGLGVWIGWWRTYVRQESRVSLQVFEEV